ncbi:MAG: hypothetical protein AB1758_22370, partial [Candidatus Eremiobacterota bacterium]
MAVTELTRTESPRRSTPERPPSAETGATERRAESGPEPARPPQVGAAARTTESGPESGRRPVEPSSPAERTGSEPPAPPEDRVEVSEEAREEPQDEFTQRSQHLDTYFDVYDNAGGDDLDGRTGEEDFERIASGDYDRDEARQRLLDQGVGESEVDAILDEAEETAQYFLDNRDQRDRVDGADDGGDVDGRIGRGDLDEILRDSREDRRDGVDLDDARATDVLERNFAILDNPGGGDTDGKISRDDLEAIASGDFDRDDARQALREAGVPEDELEAQLSEVEAAARYLLDDPDGLYRDLDVANDGDGDVDGDIRRGDVDRYRLEQREEAGEPEAPQPDEQELNEAREAAERWQDPQAVEEELARRPDLADYSPGELLALAQLSQDNPELQQMLQDRVIESVDGAESLQELPEGLGFQSLLANTVVTPPEEGQPDPAADAREHLGELVQQELDSTLDRYLEDRRGDSEADLGVDRFVADLEDLAVRNPALANELASRAQSTLEANGERIEDVRRADDSWLSQAGHAFTDGIRGFAGFVGDRLRDVGDLAGDVLSAPIRLAGEAGDFVLTQGGRLAGAGLDAVGADGAADFVRDRSAAAGDFVNGASDFVADQQDAFVEGFAEGAAGTVEGLAQVVTDPVGTARGLAAIVQDPSLLLDNYRRILEEDGVAGLAGNLAFEVVATVATGGAGAG